MASRTPSPSVAVRPARDGRPATSRAAWGSITRKTVIDAAVRQVRQKGFELLTLRGLAAELEVGPMSLYRHVRDKDDLLDEVVDRLLSDQWQPRAAESDWYAWLSETADRLRSFLVTQPAALHVYLRHPVVSPSALARMEAVMAVLRRVTANEASAREVYAAMHTYTIGFAALEASRERSGLPAAGEDLAGQLAGYTSPTQFAAGLRFILDALTRV
jgi:AcrR family transcriptional regulator